MCTSKSKAAGVGPSTRRKLGPASVVRYTSAPIYYADLLRRLLTRDDWPAQCFININFPGCAVSDITGTRIKHQGQRHPGAFSIDARHVPYHWIKIAHPNGPNPAAADLRAIEDNAISVTPIQIDFTNYEWAKRLEGVFPFQSVASA